MDAGAAELAVLDDAPLLQFLLGGGVPQPPGAVSHPTGIGIQAPGTGVGRALGAMIVVVRETKGLRPHLVGGEQGDIGFVGRVLADDRPLGSGEGGFKEFPVQPEIQFAALPAAVVFLVGLYGTAVQDVFRQQIRRAVFHGQHPPEDRLGAVGGRKGEHAQGHISVPFVFVIAVEGEGLRRESAAKACQGEEQGKNLFCHRSQSPVSHSSSALFHPRT